MLLSDREPGRSAASSRRARFRDAGAAAGAGVSSQSPAGEQITGGADGRQIEVNQLPTGLIFDVLLVPGREHLSGVLNPPQTEREEADDYEPVLARLRHLF